MKDYITISLGLCLTERIKLSDKKSSFHHKLSWEGRSGDKFCTPLLGVIVHMHAKYHHKSQVPHSFTAKKHSEQIRLDGTAVACKLVHSKGNIFFN